MQKTPIWPYDEPYLNDLSDIDINTFRKCRYSEHPQCWKSTFLGMIWVESADQPFLGLSAKNVACTNQMSQLPIGPYIVQWTRKTNGKIQCPKSGSLFRNRHFLNLGIAKIVLIPPSPPPNFGTLVDLATKSA